MKTTLLASLVLATAISYTPQSLAFDDSMSLRICEYISINDKKRLRKFLKSNDLKIRGIFDDIKCNGKNLLVFAVNIMNVRGGNKKREPELSFYCYLVRVLDVKSKVNNVTIFNTVLFTF